VQILTNSGQYPYVTNTNEIGELNTNRTKVDELFRKLMLKRLENWMILANERLKGNHTKLYLTGGNDDIMEIENVLKEYESENVLNAEGRVIDLGDGHELVSTGYTNITPWHCPRDIPEEELEKKITMMAERVKNMERAVFNLHCPPYDTPLDYAPMLDENLRVVVGTGGTPKMIPVGSKTVRKSLESYQPVLSLHGHIHESRGFVKLGRTSCFNPGSEYGEGMVRGLFVMLSDKKVESYVFTQG
jgi:Icc-related predicted phosphoesterase